MALGWFATQGACGTQVFQVPLIWRLAQDAKAEGFQCFQVPARFCPRDTAISGLRGLSYSVLDARWLPFVFSVLHCPWPQAALKGDTLDQSKEGPICCLQIQRGQLVNTSLLTNVQPWGFQDL